MISSLVRTGRSFSRPDAADWRSGRSLRSPENRGFGISSSSSSSVRGSRADVIFLRSSRALSRSTSCFPRQSNWCEGSPAFSRSLRTLTNPSTERCFGKVLLSNSQTTEASKVAASSSTVDANASRSADSPTTPNARIPQSLVTLHECRPLAASLAISIPSERRPASIIIKIRRRTSSSMPYSSHPLVRAGMMSGVANLLSVSWSREL